MIGSHFCKLNGDASPPKLNSQVRLSELERQRRNAQRDLFLLFQEDTHVVADLVQVLLRAEDHITLDRVKLYYICLLSSLLGGDVPIPIERDHVALLR